MRDIGEALDGIRLMQYMDPSMWTEEDDKALQFWLTRYLNEWLMTQRLARTERASENNHGTYYDVQIISILKFLERCGLLCEFVLDGMIRQAWICSLN
jgi:hypothetical protein